jgi:hypothetical protein
MILARIMIYHYLESILSASMVYTLYLNWPYLPRNPAAVLADGWDNYISQPGEPLPHPANAIPVCYLLALFSRTINGFLAHVNHAF